MPLKPDAKPWIIKEQIIEDPVSGLTIQFETVDDAQDPYRLRILGNLPFGNREILFGHSGRKSGAGVALSGTCRPTWLTEL